MRRSSILLVAVAAIATVAPARAASPCVATPRPDPANPFLQFQRQAFGFHDEELILCSPGSTEETHISARLWVPATCPGVGGCPAVLIAHGFGFNKEITMGDMLNAARRGMVVLSYDVRGQGQSGGQATLMGPDDVADQAALLAWLHAEVEPTKVGTYGISQGGALSWMSAIYNCGAARAATHDLSVGCDVDGRWVDAIAPLQGPVSLGSFTDGTCLVFGLEAAPYSRFNPSIAAQNLACMTDGLPVAEDVGRAVADATPPFDLAFRELRPLAGAIDVPAYVGTSFNDHLVPPQEILDLYEALDSRADYDRDLRLIVSNDGHGDVGANFAVLDDVFAWLAVQLGASNAALRDARVAIAQEWDGDAFRLEHGWPITGTVASDAFLARTAEGQLAPGPAPGDATDELRNLPVVDSPPEAPFVGGARVTGSTEIPGARLVYLGPVAGEPVEITGVPSASLWVSSASPDGAGRAQVHVSLAEITPDGEVHEFARARRALTGLGTQPQEVAIRFNAASIRLEPGNRLMLAITPSDVGVALPAWSTGGLLVHRGASYPSSVRIPTVPVDRVAPDGTPPAGASFAEDPLGTICSFFGGPCP
jgi:predicted acyl esterase